jgi:hypothetical protein
MTEHEQGTEDVQEQEMSEEELEALYETEFNKAWGDGEEDPASQESSEEEDESTEVGADDVATAHDQDFDEGSAYFPMDEEEKQEAEEAQEDDPYSWINSLPDEVKAKAERLKHSADADSGRVAAYNKKLRELRLEMDRMRSRPDIARPADKDATASEPAVHEMPKEFEQLKEDFPEFASAIDAVRAADRAELEETLAKKFAPLEEDRLRQQQDSFNIAVSEASAEIFDTEETGTDWKDVVQSEDFMAWLDMQPRSVQNAARTPDPEEAIYVLARYEDDYQAAVAELEYEESGGDSANNTPNRADKLKADRNRRKARSVSPGSKPVIADPNAEGGDYEAEFNARWG